MLKKFPFLVIVFLNVFIIAYAQDSEEELVIKAFEDYRTAILNGKSEEALDQVNEKTKTYYTELLEKIIKHDSVSINESLVVDKITILMTRGRVPTETIKSFNGDTFFKYCVDKGFISKSSVANIKVGKAQVFENFAKLPIIVNSKETGVAFQLNKEEGKWKLDLTSVMPMAEMAFAMAAKQSGMSLEELLKQAFQTMGISYDDPKLWMPID